MNFIIGWTIVRNKSITLIIKLVKNSYSLCEVDIVSPHITGNCGIERFSIFFITGLVTGNIKVHIKTMCFTLCVLLHLSVKYMDRMPGKWSLLVFLFFFFLQVSWCAECWDWSSSVLLHHSTIACPATVGLPDN